ncbi:hypothetical protein [Microbacterium sp. J1-1]|uniref:hypothetical protein n=1 Tax=Microbacterium sp. J1-1 TaxID=2992441 RepID=UPI0021144F7B|nr:hypothetical protein [Microbacterium sp. J1-1]UUE19877.1 hypothetical protein LRQ07_13915 [Microbacterium sp. J1-1]
MTMMTMTKNTTISCSRCRRKTKFKRSTGWNAAFIQGAVAGFICPTCQTPEENAEAEINEATLTYKIDAFGRTIATTKGASA